MTARRVEALPHLRLVALGAQLRLPRERHRQTHPLPRARRVEGAVEPRRRVRVGVERVLLAEQAHHRVHRLRDVEHPHERLERERAHAGRELLVVVLVVLGERELVKGGEARGERLAQRRRQRAAERLRELRELDQVGRQAHRRRKIFAQVGRAAWERRRDRQKEVGRRADAEVVANVERELEDKLGAAERREAAHGCGGAVLLLEARLGAEAAAGGVEEGKFGCAAAGVARGGHDWIAATSLGRDRVATCALWPARQVSVAAQTRV